MSSRQVVDDRDFLEIMPTFAKNVLVGFGRMEGQTVTSELRQDALSHSAAGGHHGKSTNGNGWLLGRRRVNQGTHTTKHWAAANPLLHRRLDLFASVTHSTSHSSRSSTCLASVLA